jgi:hypothetical protein
MSNSEYEFDDENSVSPEEQSKINDIRIVSYVNKQDASLIPKLQGIAGMVFGAIQVTNQEINFDLFRRVGISKIVTINNISGKNAWVMLTPAPITRLGSFGINKFGEISFVTNGEYKTQQISIINGSRSRYDLDNGMTYVSLFLNIDGKWKKVWLDRLFNTKKYDINILEKHVEAGIDCDFDKI